MATTRFSTGSVFEMKDQEKYEVIVQLMKALPVWKEVEGLQMYIISLGQPLHAALLQRVKRKPLKDDWVGVGGQPALCRN